MPISKARKAAKESIARLLQDRWNWVNRRILDKRGELKACHYALEEMKREKAELHTIINGIREELAVEVKT